MDNTPQNETPSQSARNPNRDHQRQSNHGQTTRNRRGQRSPIIIQHYYTSTMRYRNSSERERGVYFNYYNLRSRGQRTSTLANLPAGVSIPVNLPEPLAPRSTVSMERPRIPRNRSNEQPIDLVLVRPETGPVEQQQPDQAQQRRNSGSNPLVNDIPAIYMDGGNILLNLERLNQVREAATTFFPATGLSRQEIDKNTLSYDYKPKQPSQNNKNQEDGNSGNESATPEETGSCCICLDPFCSRSILRRLPCLHVFHTKCVDKWLHQNRKCPICRISVTVDYDNLMRSLESGDSVEQILTQQEDATNLAFFLDRRQPRPILEIPIVLHFPSPEARVDPE